MDSHGEAVFCMYYFHAKKFLPKKALADLSKNEITLKLKSEILPNAHPRTHSLTMDSDNEYHCKKAFYGWSLILLDINR